MLPGVLDVLPRSLMVAAAAARRFARAVEPATPAADVGDAALTDALADLASRWSIASRDLSASAEVAARQLDASATEYVEVESLLVPSALR